VILSTIAILAALAAGAAVVCLSLDSIRSWLRQRAANKYGEVLKRELANGNVEVIAIGLTEYGTRTGERTWRAKSLDQELENTFGYSERVRITL
jgi:hypothetical protein